MKKASILVLDQWASSDISVGTSKNWLYEGLDNTFSSKVLNADIGFVGRFVRFACLATAVVTHPNDFRKEYNRRIEWSTKRPRAFIARTHRFQHEIESLHQHFDIVFQIGCLFGPVFLPGAMHASYHDQTVAMVEKAWSPWLPPDFSIFRDQWMDLEKHALDSKDVILTYSNRTKRSMVDDYGIDESKVVVAPTACKLKFPSLDMIMIPRKHKILFVSTDFYLKGGDIVLDAFNILRKHLPNLELVIVGGAIPCALPEGAIHLGNLNHFELMQLYLESQLLLHPARHDAFPNVLKEAQACGLPVVASASAGIPEITCHGRTGLILETPDNTSVAEAVLELLGNAPRLEAMRFACFEDRERYRPDVCVGRIVDTLSRMLG